MEGKMGRQMERWVNIDGQRYRWMIVDFKSNFCSV